MKQVSLNGRIIRPINSKTTGILIVYSRHVKVTDMISAYVKYFELDADHTADFAHIDDTQFHCPRKYFVNNFEILEQKEPEEIWARMA